MTRVRQDKFLASPAPDVLIKIVCALRICRVVPRTVHDQDGNRHPHNLPAEDRDDIHHLVDGDKRHAPIGIVRAARHIAQLAPCLRHVAVRAGLARRQMLDPLLRCNHHRCAETHNMRELRLDRQKHGHDSTHRMSDSRNTLACTAEDRIAVTYGVHPVLMLHTAEILDRRPMAGKPYCEYSKSLRVQMLPEQAQLRRKSRKSVNKKHAVPSSRKQKRLRPLQVHSDSSSHGKRRFPALKNPCSAQAATGIVPIQISSTSAQSQL